MTQKWHKLGLVYSPESINRHPKLLTHAANPLPVLIQGDVYRVYYSGRDSQNRSSVGAVDVDIVKREIVKKHDSPFFAHGKDGSFYSDGISIGNCYNVDGVDYMLFMGWQNPKGSHWRGDIGRFIVKPDLTLQLDSETPFFTINSLDKISLSYPWVIKNSNDSYSMWYGSTITWDAGNGEMLHVINHAQSNDGATWHQTGQAVPSELGVAQAFSRPTVLLIEGKHHMWFSYRGGNGVQYRVGCAISADGKIWQNQLLDSGINVSESGWDSEMIEYPFVFEHKDNIYMLYNGNGYGKTGFGLAILVNADD